MMLKRNCKASIIVISYSSEATINDCLESVQNQRTRYPYEIILVDSSEDNTIDIVKNKFPKINIVYSHRRLLPGEARNKGLATARGDIITFLASDCIADENWLENRIKDHLDGFSLVAGVIKNEITKNLFSWANYFIEYSSISTHKDRVIVSDKILYSLSYQRNIFNTYGLFPEKIRFGEDTIFNHKLIAAGEKILFDPEITIFHKGIDNFTEFMRHFWSHGRALGFIRKKFNLSIFRFTNNDLIIPFVLLFGSWTLILLNSFKRTTKTQKLFFLLSSPLIILGLLTITLSFITEYYKAQQVPPKI